MIVKSASETLTTTIVFKDEFFTKFSLKAKYEYAAVGPEYLYPACGAMHALGILALPKADFGLLIDADVVSLSSSASAKNFVSISSKSFRSEEYHDPAL